MFVELHILQNFAPSNLNRDDTGMPKDCEFGGYRRARISSQCFKRAVRSEFRTGSRWSAQFIATRTKRLVGALVDRLVRLEEGMPTKLGAVVKFALGGAEAQDRWTTTRPNICYSSEIRRLIDWPSGYVCLSTGINLAKTKAAASSVQRGGTRRRKQEECRAKPPSQRRLKTPLTASLRVARPPTLALFGRMIADLPEKNIRRRIPGSPCHLDQPHQHGARLLHRSGRPEAR